MIARFLTTGRVWDKSGARTFKGGGESAALDKWAGKRLISIDRIDSVSTRASGGVLGWKS